MGRFPVMNGAEKGSPKLINGTMAGKTAANGAADFPLTVIFDSTIGLWLHGLLVSWDGCGLLDGTSACLWHGGSALAGAVWVMEPKDSARHEAPH